MTIDDIVQQLIIHFCEKDTFTIEEAGALTLDKALDRVPLILAALRNMEKDGLLTHIDGADNGTWILTRPIHHVGQDVGLSIQTCIVIADTIRMFFESGGMEYEPVNPFEIHEGHIRTLLQILNEALDNDGPPSKRE